MNVSTLIADEPVPASEVLQPSASSYTLNVIVQRMHGLAPKPKLLPAIRTVITPRKPHIFLGCFKYTAVGAVPVSFCSVTIKLQM